MKHHKAKIQSGTVILNTKRITSGFDDARLFARYSNFKENVPGRTFRSAPGFG